ncbi:MAG: PIN domain-containing protein [Firmicutes bacterium]|nr:PIN domain-containing protein [Bacillota bacterium]
MRRTKIYLDTSVISFYFAEDAPEKMPITREFFDELLPQGKYEVFISSLVFEELGNTMDDVQRLKLLRFADELKAETLILSDEVEQISRKFIDAGYIPVKYKEDAVHLAFALYHNIDYIVSWNFKHIVRPRTKDAVKIVAIMEGLKEVKILTPEEVIADDSEI